MSGPKDMALVEELARRLAFDGGRPAVWRHQTTLSLLDLLDADEREGSNCPAVHISKPPPENISKTRKRS